MDGLLQINLPSFVPAQSIIAPTGTVSVLCHFTAMNCLLDNPGNCESASAEFTFNYNDTPVDVQTISLQLPKLVGSLLITAASLKYMMATYNGLQPSTREGFMPAAIVSAMSLLGSIYFNSLSNSSPDLPLLLLSPDSLQRQRQCMPK